ncbi:MAG: inositol monophosphatase [Haloferacaceae archaeon]
MNGTDDADATEVLAVAHRAVDAGREAAMEGFRAELAARTKENSMDRVTDADEASQERILDVIADAAPEHPVVAEEADALKEVPEAGPAWVVDPIDGTNNYAAGSRLWTVSVAFVRDGEPRAAVTDLPMLDDRYAAAAAEESAGEAEGGTTRNSRAASPSEAADPDACTVATVFGLSPDVRSVAAEMAQEVTVRFGDLRRLGSAQATLAMVAAGEIDGAVATRLEPWDVVGGAHLVDQAGGRVTDLAGDPWRHGADGLVASNGRCHEPLCELAADVLGDD